MNLNPKDKAKELVYKFRDNISICMNCNDIANNVQVEKAELEDLKKCALICVEEYLSFQENLYITEGSIAYKYWQEVKQEIEKL